MFRVYYQGAVVGTADMRRKGLYYEITCKCCFDNRQLYRIVAICGDNRKDIGVCVPSGFRTIVPIKSLGEGAVRFEAVPEGAQERFVEVHEEKTFCYLKQLRCARFQRIEGKSGVILPE